MAQPGERLTEVANHLHQRLEQSEHAEPEPGSAEFLVLEALRRAVAAIDTMVTEYQDALETTTSDHQASLSEKPHAVAQLDQIQAAADEALGLTSDAVADALLKTVKQPDTN